MTIPPRPYAHYGFYEGFYGRPYGFGVRYPYAPSAPFRIYGRWDGHLDRGDRYR
jgi:hypothetical protein